MLATVVKCNFIFSFVGSGISTFGFDVSRLLHSLHDCSFLFKWPFFEESVCEVHLSFGQLSLLFDAFGMCFTTTGTVNNAGTEKKITFSDLTFFMCTKKKPRVFYCNNRNHEAHTHSSIKVA